MHVFRNYMWCACVVALLGCGGSGDETVTVHTTLKRGMENEYTAELLQAMAAKDVFPLGVACGYYDLAKTPGSPAFGNVVNIAYFEIYRNQVGQLRTIQTLDGFNELTRVWADAHSDPVKCGANFLQVMNRCCR